ncbi:MAG: alpha/beta hydrolase, partial [Gammaproteobacteria bacterium]|nr:alpha/beta hydrolase [Gammaproteobacteria bacterium]
EPDAVSRLVLEQIQQKLEDAELEYESGTLLFQDSVSDVTVEDGCNRTVILRMNTDIEVLEDTTLSLTLDSLYEPISVSLNLLAGISAQGRARQIFGIRIDDCVDLGRDSFDFLATGQIDTTITATLELNPQWSSENVLSFFPTFNLQGMVNHFSPSIDIDDTIFRRILEDFLLDQIRDAFSNSALGDALETLETELQQDLDDSLTDGRFDLELPPADDAQILALYRLLQPDARFPLTLDMLQQHRQLILAALILGETSALADFVQDALLCQASDALRVPITPIPIYSDVTGACELVDISDIQYADTFEAKTLFTDDSCATSFSYMPTTASAYCDVALDTQRLGNPASFPHEIDRWILSDGTRFDIGALSIDGLTQPFVQRVNYKSVNTPAGVCELEMRVYSNNPNDNGNRSVIAFHGGSWQRRGSGALGIDATAVHFTNRGFTVFAPFYRLVGDADGTAACQDASLEDLIADAQSALDWVISEQQRYGSSGKPTVFGQSAGGHLAMSLLVNRPDEIDRGVLFYAPTDFSDFVAQVNSGDYNNPAGVRILEAITGASLAELSLDAPIVVDNSFPTIVAQDPSAYPPVFLLHGELDTLLSFRQSARLCNGYSGSLDPSSGPAPLEFNLTSLKNIIQCDSGGTTLHLIAEGEHALDLCIARGLCLSGSEASAQAVAESVDRMLDWVNAEDTAFSDSSENGGSAGGVGWLVISWLLWLSIYRFLHSVALVGYVSRCAFK